MVQEYSKYTKEDFEVWQILFDRQFENLNGKVHPYYYDCLGMLDAVLNRNAIPQFQQLGDILYSAHGWTIEVVPGIIPVDDFFALLAQKKFCSSTWLRQKSQLDYLEEPDMFHDIFGHIPLLMNADYAKFMQKIGQLGVDYNHDSAIILQLKRLYWFTVEFGLCRNKDEIQIIGAGTISSFGETNHIYSDSIVKVHDFDISEIINKAFNNSEIQNEYFALNSFEDLYHAIDDYKNVLAGSTS